MEGGPYAPVKPPPRVSATRHGVIAMKGRGTGTTLTACVRALPDAWTVDGVHRSGAGQLYTSCASAMGCWLSAANCPKARGEERRNKETKRRRRIGLVLVMVLPSFPIAVRFWITLMGSLLSI